MAQVRVLRHYVHTPLLITITLEAAAIFGAAFTGYATRYGFFPEFSEFYGFALLFTMVLSLSNFVMGVHESRLREGEIGMMLRGGVAFFLVGTLAMAVVMYLIPPIFEGRGVLLFSTIEAFVFVSIIRWQADVIFDEDFMKRRVLVLGTGRRALKIASRMRRRSDQRAFVLVGYLQFADAPDLVSEYGANVRKFEPGTLAAVCAQFEIDEVVVAADNRRQDDSGAEIPFVELMDLKLSGVEVCEIQDFVEREVGKLDIDLLRRSWLVFSQGFTTNWFRAFNKRVFDVVAAIVLGIVFAPIMLATGLMILVGEGFKPNVIYRQKRIGLNGQEFEVLKFRTMVEDAEESGAVWAEHDDPRVTRIGSILRKTHLDELPQLLNVLLGEMSMVGPRPERPVFVEHLTNELEFYNERHRVKPGVTGWAQLCYPYGASIEDAKEKLQYDLYYLKNNSFLLDVIILLQTVEAIVVGEGAR